MPRESKEIKFNIEEMYGIISDKEKGWQKELNLVSWDGREAKYDIREWSPEHDKMGKGITLSETEARNLYELLGELFEE